jgi:poly(3-hydroxybutyrate) depolymerase
MKRILTTALALFSVLLLNAAKVDKAVNIKVGNKTRKYRLYVPNNVKENTALVFCLHGTGGSSDNKQPSFDAIANADGIIVVYGHGENVKFPFFGNMELPGWNSTGEWSGDVDYIKAIIEDVASKYSIDRKRIYCCGFSNGGMMTYTVANLLGDVFAAYASISGYPINEFHLHHTGSRPVPFLHIHGTNDDLVKSSLVSKIIDNMVARNGCNPVPETITKSGKFTKKVYAAGEGGFPIVFYSINGMGHSPETNATEEGNASKTMWNFMKQYTLDAPCDTTLKWRPCIEQEGWTPKSHGWTINSGTTICSFGKDQNTSSNANVYPSLQFITGKYKLCFKSAGEEGKTIGVKIVKLTGKKNAVLDATVNVGEQVELPFEVADGWGEYKLTMTREDAADEITVTDIAVHSVPEAAPDAVAAPKANAKADGAVYSLSGVRQTKNPAGKGIYIANGKKVLKK